MPKVEDIFSRQNGAKYLSTLDLHTGYHHLPLDEDTIPQTSFTSPFGKYEYLKVPSGLSQAAVYLQEITMKLSRFPFSAKEIQYLGHVFSTTSIKPLPFKTDETPKNSKHIKAFLGLVGYYCKFIKNFAQIAKPLTALTY